MWKSAGRMVSKGLRMFRESLLEGAKVAHMFKEDLDEGMSTIMRQNRGVKVVSNNQNQQEESSSAGSFFDSQVTSYFSIRVNVRVRILPCCKCSHNHYRCYVKEY